ncbi:DUF2157 domain-containing protein [Segetibacter aerophilus]|uniref:DUF2157 domain-containing protein n=1 Tax=Segetibacter aerophilus TaxID=670293 RepID=A0A512BG54_9BACT|nr:DUF2157 domain-containing protein [Segetibacter aerophilus]GEO10948.1 hypothetical protein SAE01_34440 [Segetibacter aerophilus]
MDIPLFRKLLEKGLISEGEFECVEQHERAPLSIYIELTSILSLGILLFTTAIGILVYKNIDSIGHAALITMIAATCIFCFAFCIRKAKGYSNKKVDSPTALFDYFLIFGCLLLVTLVGYLQFEYKVFGVDWGLATFVPMVVLFTAAYYFDHIDVLSMAITNLAAWAGLTVAPLNIIRSNDFQDEQLIFTAIILGAGLLALSFLSSRKQVKQHFAFTYKNFGAHLLFISILAALFHFDHTFLVWFLVLAVIFYLFFRYAIRVHSFYFLVVTLFYGYIGLSYVMCNFLFFNNESTGGIYAATIYFLVSGISLIKALIYYNQLLKNDAHLY